MAGHIADSKSQSWCTPKEEHPYIYEAFGGENRIDVDPCTNRFSTLQARVKYSLPDHDGLEFPWNPTNGISKVFANPPWGKAWRKPATDGKRIYEYMGAAERTALKLKLGDDAWKKEAALWTPCGIDKWIRRAYALENKGPISILLVPAYVDTKVWHEVVWPHAAAVCFPEGRISFDIYDDETGEQIPSDACPTACAYLLFCNRVWDGTIENFNRSFSKRGKVILL